MSAAATALVIDDEVLVRQLVRRMLEPDLCQVLEAGDGEAGLRLIERQRAGIDVVLTDLLMPGIDGYDVVEVLAEHCPELPVACMSGFANHGSVGLHLPVPLLPKPFDADALRAMVAPLIARARALRAQAAAEVDHGRQHIQIAQNMRRRSDANLAAALDLVAAARELRSRRAAERAKG